ncbi:MAG: aspartate carbamoyltransferase regulatory subunit [Candidatus Muirbacterium halophilum]|nr:aspartate carbamoyltransferase regulatory subunit [Candidatus Muirbacterium halophilum]MCK9474459.1 aspartate carbamoyltransferase regulatory subunit [Candidatus Muirbacterium halophilum]
MKNDRPYKVYRIEEGIVIDHIPCKMALNVLKVLGLEGIEHNSTITMGINLPSSKLGYKDVIKIENKNLSDDDLNKIAIVAPHASINIIKDGNIAYKHNAKLPEILINTVKCPNPICVTRLEEVKSKFYNIKNGKKLKCHFCEREFELKYVSIL